MTNRGRRGGRFAMGLLVVGVLLMGVAALVMTTQPFRAGADLAAAPTTTPAPVTTTATSTPSPTPTPTPTGPPRFATNGPGTYGYAQEAGPVLGRAGQLRRFRVAVESGLPVSVSEFAAELDDTLGDPRSWIASGALRLQRVPPGVAANFTVFLVTPGTAFKICSAGGVDIRLRGQAYTSCRVGPKVVLNAARYFLGIPNYGAPLEVYRQYAINHEVGHALGHGHELCTGAGRPAPVMQQQTLSLLACVANPWPYLNGKRYAGPSGSV